MTWKCDAFTYTVTHLFHHEFLEVPGQQNKMNPNFLKKQCWHMFLNSKLHDSIFANYRYIYETSRKHPFLYGPTILTMSACYETVIQSCCQEENMTECFQMKVKYLYVNCYLEPCYANGGQWTSSICTTWQLVGNAESEALLQIC